MHQQLKLEHGEIQTPSQYCPLDLFSSSQTRLGKAIASLFQEPQNNLKLFIDSKLCFSGTIAPSSTEAQTSDAKKQRPRLTKEEAQEKSRERLEALKLNLTVVNDHLTRQQQQQQQQQQEKGKDKIEMEVESLIELLVDLLLQDGVLTQVRKAQELDKLDVEVVCVLFQAVVVLLEQQSTSSLSLEEILNEPLDVLDELLRLSGPSSFEEEETRKLIWIKEMKLGQELTILKALEYIHNYCVAATAKDCSVMITLSPTKEEGRRKSKGRGVVSSKKELGQWKYKIALIDVDRKYPEHILHYHKLDHKIANHFLNKGGESCCSHDASQSSS
jgi:inositol-pentakisphosphate 2-kinase